MPTIASHALAPRPPKNERPRSATASAAHFFAAQRAARAAPAAAPADAFFAQQQAWQHRVEQRVQAARDREEEQLAASRVPTSPPVRTAKPAPGLAHTSHEDLAEAVAACGRTAYLSAAPRILSPAGAAAAFAATPRPATADSALHERLWRDSQAWQQRREELYAEGARRRAAAERRVHLPAGARGEVAAVGGGPSRGSPTTAARAPAGAAGVARAAPAGAVGAREGDVRRRRRRRRSMPSRSRQSRAERRPPARRTLSGCAPRARRRRRPPPPPSPVPHEWRGGADTTLIAAVVAARDAAAAAMAPAAAPAVAVRDATAVAPSPIGSKLREAEAAAFEAQEAWWRDEEARKHAETAAWRAPAPAAAVGGPSSPPTFAPRRSSSRASVSSTTTDGAYLTPDEDSENTDPRS